MSLFPSFIRSGFSLLWLVILLPGFAGQTVQAFQESPEKATNLREKTIYIPFEKLRDVFEKGDRKVVLSYEEFDRLWKAARQNASPAPPPEARRGPIISQADSRAEIGGSVVSVQSKLKIELLSGGWNEVVLGLKNSAISRARIGETDARLLFDPAVGYKLLTRNETGQPQTVELELEYKRAFRKDAGQSSVSFQAPQAPVNRWRVRIPESQVKIDMEPLIAVTNPAVGDEKEVFDPASESVVLAFLGAAPQVTLKWNPKSEGASGLAAIVSAQTVQQVTVEKNVQRTQVQILYEISRAELPALRIEVPGEQKVTNVFNENVKKWKVEKQGAKQIIVVDLFSPIQGSQSLTVELEKLTEEKLKQDFRSAVVNAMDASRQQGIVAVRLAEGLRSVSRNRLGLLQLDKSELPASLKRTSWDLAFRYAALPYQLDLSIEKILPRIVVRQLTEVDVTPQKISAAVQLVYDVQQAGVFATDLKIPEGFSVRSIAGYSRAKKVPAIPVSEYRQDENDPSLWHVDFSRKALGEVGLLVELEQELSDPNLLTPTGDVSVLNLPLPVSADSQVEYTEGNVVVYGPESLRIYPEKEGGLQKVTVSKATERISARGSRASPSRAVLSYAHAGDQNGFSVNVLRRKPQVTVRQLLTARVDSGVIRYDAQFRYEILYSGVKGLRIDIPSAIAYLDTSIGTDCELIAHHVCSSVLD